MSIISARDNENNRWKRNSTKKNKDRKEQGGTEAMMKGWELNDFVVHLSQVINYFINYFKTKRVIWVKACCGGV